MRCRGRLPGRHIVVDAVVEDGRLTALEPPAPGSADLGDADCVLCSGWLDLQVNGYRGVDLCAAFGAGDGAVGPEAVAALAELIPASGAARFLPTITTNTPDAISGAMRAIASACEQSPRLAAQMPGIHLEGPFIAPEDGPRGAHPLEAVRDPDWDLFRRFQDAAGGRIRLLTLAPERPGAIELIHRAASSGVTVSIGHSGAEPDDIRAAADAGATMSTHLGNGAHAVLPRHPNYVWEQLAEDRLVAAVIADLHHLPASVLTCFARVKGPRRLVLASDVAALGGLPAGVYNNGRHEVLPSGRVNLAGTPYLAGAGHCLDWDVANARRVLDWPEDDLLRTVTSTAAAAVDLPARGPLPEIGQPADLTIFRWPANGGPAAIVGTVCAGEVLHRG